MHKGLFAAAVASLSFGAYAADWYVDAVNGDAGDDAFFSVDMFGGTDLAGNARFYKGGTIDIGCFELSGIIGIRVFVR